MTSNMVDDSASKCNCIEQDIIAAKKDAFDALMFLAENDVLEWKLMTKLDLARHSFQRVHDIG